MPPLEYQLTAPALYWLMAAGVFWLAQLFYLIGFGRLLRKKLYQAPESEDWPGVSIIVAANQEEANLRELIPQLTQQDYPHFEIIVADDRSTDGTYDYLLELLVTTPQVRMVRIHETPLDFSPKKYALTLAIKAAQNNLLLFTDADCRPASPQWIRQMVAATGPQTELVLGISRYRPKPGLLNALIRYETLLTHLQFLRAAQGGSPYMGVGRNLLYTKSLFFKHKGFLSHIRIVSGDDDLFVQQAAAHTQTQICPAPEGHTQTEPETSWKAYFAQKNRHVRVSRGYKRKAKLIPAFYALSYLGVQATAIGGLVVGTLFEKFIFGGLLLIFVLLRVLLFWRVQKKWQFQLPGWILLCFELFFGLYYFIVVIPSLLSRKTTWR